jgi:hypothetical protein
LTSTIDSMDVTTETVLLTDSFEDKEADAVIVPTYLHKYIHRYIPTYRNPVQSFKYT